VHSVRLPGFALSTDVILAAAGDRLVIRHEAGASAEPYVAGTLLAVRRVGEVTGVLRGLDRLLFGS
jgi:4-hydroxy-tetrahydrodipicolinate reductase